MHTRIHDGDSPVMRWVMDNLSARALSKVGMMSQVPKPFEAPPALVGFESD